MHPNTKALLAHFNHSHLPENLAVISAKFWGLAHQLAVMLEGPELPPPSRTRNTNFLSKRTCANSADSEKTHMTKPKTCTQMHVRELTGPMVICSAPGDLTPSEIVTHLNKSVREYRFYLDDRGRVCYRTSGIVTWEHQILE